MLLETLKHIPDHRRPEGREYYLHHILLFSILGLLSGSKTYTDLERFMQTHFEKLKTIFKLKWRRVPHFSAIRKIIIGVCPDDIESAFRTFSGQKSEAVPTSGLRQVCFDGKFLNGSFSHVHDKRAFNVFQAFANYSQIILAHLCVEGKENEIPAFHEFLLSLNLKDCLVTADAMHFQKNFETAEKRGIGIAIQLKKNQETLYNQVVHGCKRFKPLDCQEDSWEKGHGRLEKRTYEVFETAEMLKK